MKVNNHGYVYCSPKERYKNKNVGLYAMSLHKILMNPDKKGKSIVVDHKDGNKLNNQKENLRVCTHTENMQNRKIQKQYANQKKVSQYKGVYWDRGWRSQMGSNAEKVYIGSYDSEITAANAYNHRAKELFGEFALLNDVPYMSIEEVELKNKANSKTSKYRGVSFFSNRYIAQIWNGTRNIRIGSFIIEIEAALAYDLKATELKGNRAKLNFPTK